jgi:nitrous oxidase accessory protein NosD
VVLEAADTFQPVIQVRYASQGASTSVIEGLTISGAAVSFGVSVADASQVRLRACVFEENLTAVEAAGDSVVAIEACTFRDNYSACAQARDNATLHIADSSFTGEARTEMVRTLSTSRAVVLVENSSFINTGQMKGGNGVLINEGGTAIVRACSFGNFEDAIQTHGGTDFRVEANHITGCVSGVTVWNGQPATTEVRISGNRVEDCSTGITLVGRTKSVDISGNLISASAWGIIVGLPACGMGSDVAPFEGDITGTGNRIIPDACPPFSSPFWPSGFLGN